MDGVPEKLSRKPVSLAIRFGREVSRRSFQEEGRSDAKDSGALFTPGVEANEGIIIIGRRECETAVQERVEFTQELATIRR